MSLFRLRHPQAADAAEVAALVAAMDAAVQGATDFTVADLEEEWRTIDLERDAWLVLDGDRIAAYGTVEPRGELWLQDGYVHPDLFGRGVGTMLVRTLEDEVVRRGAKRVQNAVLEADARAQELLREQGYSDVRRFWRMAIELQEQPADPSWPEGLAAGGFDPGRDAEPFHAALQEAFEDTYAHRYVPFEEWRARVLESPSFDPSLWCVVRDGDEIAAGTVVDPDRFGGGWVTSLFTRRQWRRRGLGEALLLDAFRTFWARGQRLVGLGVDAESPTGATRLYERAGMHVSWGAVAFEKSVDG